MTDDLGPQRGGSLTSQDRYYLLVGIGLGLILILLALIPQLVGMFFDHQRPLLFCGLGICLGAVGSTATVRWKGVVITGAGALAAFLSWQFPASERVVWGVIEGSEWARDVSLIGERSIFIGRAKEPDRYRFGALETDLRTATLTLNLVFPENADTKEPGAHPTFYCLKRELLTKRLGSSDRVQWRVLNDRLKGFILEDSDGSELATSSAEVPSCSRQHSDLEVGMFQLARSLIPAALAQPSFVVDLSDFASEDLERIARARAALSAQLNRRVARENLTVMQRIYTDGTSGLTVIEGMLKSWNDVFTRSIPTADEIFTPELTEDDLYLLTSMLGSTSSEVWKSAAKFLANFALLRRENASRVIKHQTGNAITQATKRSSLQWDISVINSLTIIRSVACSRPSIQDALGGDIVNTVSNLQGKIGPGADGIIREITSRRCSGLV